ncbi:MAG: hypothetical protein J4G18_04720 [Anaerolineae bacterium]|nr:hypothetical protein [Anaerolineae bacterium]
MSRFLPAFLLLLLLAAPGFAQDEEAPTVAILRFGSLASRDISEGGVLDILESYGYLSEEENRVLEERVDYAADKVNIVWGDASFEFSNIGAMIERALDAGADVLITFSTPVTLSAVNLTLDMEEPPPVLFSGVQYPYEAGIASSACIKPAHVTGTEISTSYEYVFEALLEQDPDMERIGIIHSTTEASGTQGAAEIAAVAAAQEIVADTVGVVSVSDLRAAANALVNDGAQAILLPVDSITTQGLPIVVTVANENGIPVFYPSLGAVYYGATIGAGYSRYYETGLSVGVLLANYLNGDLDVATTAINIATGKGIGINMDSADEQGVAVAESLMQRADAVYRAGRTVSASPALRQAIARRGVVIPLEDRLDADLALLESLQCTDEMIAEQQAALDAASG